MVSITNKDILKCASRTLLYLQLKQDLQQNRLPVDNSEDLVDLAAVALQGLYGQFTCKLALSILFLVCLINSRRL